MGSCRRMDGFFWWGGKAYQSKIISHFEVNAFCSFQGVGGYWAGVFPKEDGCSLSFGFPSSLGSASLQTRLLLSPQALFCNSEIDIFQCWVVGIYLKKEENLVIGTWKYIKNLSLWQLGKDFFEIRNFMSLVHYIYLRSCNTVSCKDDGEE